MNIEQIFSAVDIQQRVRELGAAVSQYYSGKELTLVAVLNGGIFFAADLARAIDLELFMDTIAVMSYSGHESTGSITLRCPPKLSVKGRHVLVVDDVLDTGLSLQWITGYFVSEGAESVKTCVLTRKDVERKGVSSADWVGFEAPGEYLVGYGLDSCEALRNLPYIGTVVKV